MFRSKSLSHPFFVSTLVMGGLALVACESSDPAADPSGGATSVGAGGEASTSSGGEATSSSSGGETTGTTGGSSGDGGMGQGAAPGSGGMGQGGAGGQGGGGPVVEPATCMGPMTGTDTCPGEAITLNVGDSVTLCGDLTNATNDFTDPFCAGASDSGPDNVYNVITNGAGSLKVKLKKDGGELNPTMYLRYPESLIPGACSDNTGAASGGCYDYFMSSNEDFGIDWDSAFLPGFHLIVDAGHDIYGEGTTGRYELELSYEAPACGDSVWNWLSEECDDGNAIDGDGCSSSCLIEADPIHDTCPGEPLFVQDGQTLASSSTTFGRTDSGTPVAQGSCAAPSPGGGDRVYRFTATWTGLVKATVGLGPDCETDICETEGTMSAGCWDAMVWVTRETCGDTAKQVACADSTVFGKEEAIFWGEVGEDYYIFVDGVADFAFGNYNLCLRQY